MDISFTKEDAEIRARTRAFTEEVLYPLEIEVDEADGLSAEAEAAVRQAVRDSGLGAINHAREVGGQGMSLVQQSIVNEEAGKATGSLWSFLWQPPLCLRDGTPEQVERYLVPACRGELSTAYCITESDAGSDVSAVRTRAVRDGDHFVIDGEKVFATHAESADLVLLHAHVDGDPKQATIFLVDRGTEGLEVVRIPRFMKRDWGSHPELAIRGLRVQEDRILGSVGEGFELTKDWFVEARVAIAARCVGMATRATELANDFAADRVQFGTPIRDFQGIEFMLADMATRIMAAKSLLYRVAAEIDAGLDRRQAHAKVSAIKLYCSETGWWVVDKALQIFGGRGYMCDNPVERLYRDIRVERIWEGTSEIQKVIIAGQIKKRGLDLYTGWPG
jgi:alkylation response protein AidB-like acyl-CoA dehydrogenase